MESCLYMFALLMVIALIRGVDDENRGRQYAEDGQNKAAEIYMGILIS